MPLALTNYAWLFLSFLSSFSIHYLGWGGGNNRFDKTWNMYEILTFHRKKYTKWYNCIKNANLPYRSKPITISLSTVTHNLFTIDLRLELVEKKRCLASISDRFQIVFEHFPCFTNLVDDQSCLIFVFPNNLKNRIKLMKSTRMSLDTWRRSKHCAIQSP